MKCKGIKILPPAQADCILLWDRGFTCYKLLDKFKFEVENVSRLKNISMSIISSEISYLVNYLSPLLYFVAVTFKKIYQY